MFVLELKDKEKKAFAKMIDTSKAESLEEIEFLNIYVSIIKDKLFGTSDFVHKFSNKELTILSNMLIMKSDCKEEFKTQAYIYDLIMENVNV